MALPGPLRARESLEDAFAVALLDARAAVEHDYERRRDLHRARRGLPPVVKKPPTKGGPDVVVLLAVAGVVAVVLLLVWAVVSAR